MSKQKDTKKTGAVKKFGRLRRNRGEIKSANPVSPKSNKSERVARIVLA
jgi:hypothetical protein